MYGMLNRWTGCCGTDGPRDDLRDQATPSSVMVIRELAVTRLLM